MKTALLHYWLTNMRGGEKVLQSIAELLPKSDIFTHAYIPKAFGEKSSKSLWGHSLHESLVSRLPLGRRHPQAYLPILPMASRGLNLADYNLLVSSESGPIKGVCKHSYQSHICYCHTPMRYLWDMHEYYFKQARPCAKLAMKLFTKYLRREDLRSVDAVDAFVANSSFVAERIKRIYRRDAVVVHPPVDVDFFSSIAELPSLVPFQPKSYYLYAGELTDYKQPQLALEAVLKMNRNLVVVGNGKMREGLLRLVRGKKNVVFLGRVSNEDLRGIYVNAKALLFPGIEDFGIVPVEAQASGVPVIAFGVGGACETVVDRETGLLFNEQSVESLSGAIEQFEVLTFSPSNCQRNAQRFSKEKFQASFCEVLKPYMK